jgi:hypothetical protein
MKRYVKLFESWKAEETDKENAELALEIATEQGIDPEAVRFALDEINPGQEEFEPETTELGLGPITMMAAGLATVVLATVIGKYINDWQDSRDRNKYWAKHWLHTRIIAELEAAEPGRSISNEELAKAVADSLLNDKELEAEFKARLEGRVRDRGSRNIFDH